MGCPMTPPNFPTLESPADMPVEISPEAWEAAMVIDEEVKNHLRLYGFKTTKDSRSKMSEVCARLTQLAMNKYFARIVAAETRQ